MQIKTQDITTYLPEWLFFFLIDYTGKNAEQGLVEIKIGTNVLENSLAVSQVKTHLPYPLTNMTPRYQP